MTATLPDVHDLLPHRAPFLLIDRLTAIDPGRRAEGVKRITGDEWCMRGTPGTPFPATLVLEALAQLSAGVMIGLADAPAGAVGYFMGLGRVKVRGEARVGDTLVLACTLLAFRRGICRTRGEAFVDGRRILRAELTTIIRAP
ncbi:MAG: beta-hydroxyacyl-ACP dehydratase [Gemmatimonadaceae bacterium]|nr:beta-hydroxyacyl-ACP dehydratase [Gemmatimonadaceae bacterium]